VNKGFLFVERREPYIAFEMLNASNLKTQHGLFKVTMKANCDLACAPPFNLNLLIKL
jgi:hypothetical protein